MQEGAELRPLKVGEFFIPSKAELSTTRRYSPPKLGGDAIA